MQSTEMTLKSTLRVIRHSNSSDSTPSYQTGQSVCLLKTVCCVLLAEYSMWTERTAISSRPASLGDSPVLTTQSLFIFLIPSAKRQHASECSLETWPSCRPAGCLSVYLCMNVHVLLQHFISQSYSMNE